VFGPIEICRRLLTYRIDGDRANTSHIGGRNAQWSVIYLMKIRPTVFRHIRIAMEFMSVFRWLRRQEIVSREQLHFKDAGYRDSVACDMVSSGNNGGRADRAFRFSSADSAERLAQLLAGTRLFLCSLSQHVDTKRLGVLMAPQTATRGEHGQDRRDPLRRTSFSFPRVSRITTSARSGFSVVGGLTGGVSRDLLRGLPGERPKIRSHHRSLPIPADDPIYGVSVHCADLESTRLIGTPAAAWWATGCLARCVT